MQEQPHQEGTITRTLQDLPLRPSADFRMIYANSVHFAMLPWDLTLIFGQVIGIDPQDPYVEQRMSVTLSPLAAKMALEFLQRNIAAYEQQYGEIRLTPPSRESTEEPSA
jgi:hypothetical protein